MIFRIALPEDVASINDIYNYEVLHGTATFDTRERSLENAVEWFRSHQSKRHIIEICTDDSGQLVAYCSLSSYRDKDAFESTAEISIYVCKGYQGQKIGYTMCSRMIEYARKTGLIRNIIAVITSSNTPSIRLFKKLGFEDGGTIRCAGIKFGEELGITNLYKIL
ncbi:MAG: GNAT family N-acetyltransferase [Succinivibrio sp.]